MQGDGGGVMVGIDEWEFLKEEIDAMSSNGRRMDEKKVYVKRILQFILVSKENLLCNVRSHNLNYYTNIIQTHYWVQCRPASPQRSGLNNKNISIHLFLNYFIINLVVLCSLDTLRECTEKLFSQTIMN